MMMKKREELIIETATFWRLYLASAKITVKAASAAMQVMGESTEQPYDITPESLNYALSHQKPKRKIKNFAHQAAPPTIPGPMHQRYFRDASLRNSAQPYLAG